MTFPVIEGPVLRTAEEAAHYATITNRLLSTMGAARHLEDFAAVSRLGEKEAVLVLAFNNAYDDYILGRRSKEALRLYEAFRDELHDLIVKRVGAEDYKRCARDLYRRELAVQFGSTGAADAIADVLRSSVRRALRDGAALVQDAEKLQSAVYGLIAKVGRGREFRQAFRTFHQVVKTDEDALIEAFAYLFRNQQGVRAARAALRKNRESYMGYLRKLQGTLFEAYAARSRAWLSATGKKLREARELAATLGPGWKAIRVTGGLRIGGREAWDEAILIVRQQKDRTAGEAILFMAAQFKAEKQLSAIRQTIRDAAREADSLTPYAEAFSSSPNVITAVKGGKELAFTLVPSPGGVPTYRYIVNTAGTAIDEQEMALLAQLGAVVEHLELGITAQGMTALADAFAKAALKALP
jgi:hypothetical protein